LAADGGERRRERIEKRERREREGEIGMTYGPAATWQPRHRNHLAKPPDGQKRTISRV
jgi:hypothetical protein